MFKKNSIRSDFTDRVRLSIESLSRGDEWRYYCTNSDLGFKSLNYGSEFNTLLKNHEIIGILLQLESKKIAYHGLIRLSIYLSQGLSSFQNH